MENHARFVINRKHCPEYSKFSFGHSAKGTADAMDTDDEDAQRDRNKDINMDDDDSDGMRERPKRKRHHDEG